MSNGKHIQGWCPRLMVVSAACLLLILTGPIQAEHDTRLYSAGAGARALGMGGAFTSYADDVSSVFYNPAGLASPNASGITGEYHYLSGQTQGMFVAGVASSMVYGGHLGAGFLSTQTRERLLISRGFANSSTSQFWTSYGRTYGDYDFGLNLRLTDWSVFRESETTAGIDLGARYHATEDLTLGLLLRDPIASQPDFEDRDLSNPATVVAGLSKAIGLSDMATDIVGAAE